jgi:hypothetical protein
MRKRTPEPHETHADDQLEFLRALLDERAFIDDDVLEFGTNGWAIHGVIPYDGEVPMAVFGTYNEARHVLDELGERMPPPDF